MEPVKDDKWYKSVYYTVISVISLIKSPFTKSEKLPVSTGMKIPPSSNDSSSVPAGTSYPTFSIETNRQQSSADMPASTESLSNHGQEATSGSVPSSCTAQFTTTIVGLGSSALSALGEGFRALLSLTLESSQSDSRMNPIVQLFREQELGKTVLTYVIPMTTGILTAYTTKQHSSSSLPLPWTVLPLCIGLTAMLLRNMLGVTVANAVEQFGAASIFFAFFSVVSSLLPENLVWVPWTCFAVILLPSILSCLPVRDTAQIDSEN